MKAVGVIVSIVVVLVLGIGVYVFVNSGNLMSRSSMKSCRISWDPDWMRCGG